MPEARQRSTAPLWWGLVAAAGAMVCNVVFFTDFTFKRPVVYLSVALAVAALALTVIGVSRAFSGNHSAVRRAFHGLVLLVSLFLVGISGYAFHEARKIPPANTAPEVGQVVPDFTLSDTHGRPVTLSKLFETDGQPANKGVLLVFYRGYW